ncbi:MAG: hypothetical protein V2A78_09655 [bacterium]
MGKNDRDGRGRFGPGNKGGPGRPPRADEREYLTTLFCVCPLETWQAICEKAVEAAKAGDKEARKFLAGYLLPTTAEQELYRRRAENPFPDLGF